MRAAEQTNQTSPTASCPRRRASTPSFPHHGQAHPGHPRLAHGTTSETPTRHCEPLRSNPSSNPATSKTPNVGWVSAAQPTDQTPPQPARPTHKPRSLETRHCEERHANACIRTTRRGNPEPDLKPSKPATSRPRMTTVMPAHPRHAREGGHPRLPFPSWPGSTRPSTPHRTAVSSRSGLRSLWS